MNALSPVLPIGAQITDVVRAHERMPRRKALDLAIQALEQVGLRPEHARSYPYELSGGMRQRAVIAMATVLNPDLLVMDEPTTALDVVTQRLVLDQVTRLSSELGFAVVLITHDLPLLLEWAHRIVVMYAGSVVEAGNPDDIARDPYHPYTGMLLRSFPPLSGPRRELEVIPGQPWDLRRQAGQCLFADRCASVMDACRVATPRLVGHSNREVACFLKDPADPVSLAPARTEEGQ
jgi:peptide/nickel transport system ATP-binding protein